MFPLARDIIPEWIHPKTKDHIDILIDKLSNEDKKSILKIKNLDIIITMLNQEDLIEKVKNYNRFLKS